MLRAAGAASEWRRLVAALRHRLIAVAQERLPREPWLVGMFWWKWMPGSETSWDRRDRDFSMRGVPAAVSTRP